MDGPYKIDFVLAGDFYQFLQLCSFFFRIRQTPVGSTMIRIVFRAVYISIHLILSIKLQLAKSCLMAPGSSIKSFYYTTVTDGRIILNLHFRQFSIFQQLHKSLQSVVSAPFVISCQNDFLIGYRQVIGFIAIGNQAAILPYALVSFLTDIDTESVLGALLAMKQLFENFHCMRICFFFTYQLVDGGQSNGFVTGNKFLGSRLQANILRECSEGTRETSS